ncbi:SRPBCC family protein [Zhihengliuella flava]|uniref:Membrane protein n=1 Tax=Zhihengliuella flava TaxID=1285193 RepID=A0A931GF75_9MICC|nr:SRPBCC family protein [Zhihengliuella flava]MBG6085113.1 putative membrane protein [Zhihengliuella flava]
MVDVTTSLEIARPRAAVAAFAMDPVNVPHWYANIRSVERLGTGPFEVGERAVFEAVFAGRTLRYVYEVREREEGRLLIMSTADGPFPMRTTYRFSDTAEGGTLMELRNDGEPRGFSRIAAPAMSAMMRRENRKDLRRLRAHLEAQPEDSDGQRPSR